MKDRIIKVKAFIYRFSMIFGLRIYLANREEQDYIDSLGKVSALTESISRGAWQGKYGFTSVWTYKKSLPAALIAKVKHAFTFR